MIYRRLGNTGLPVSLLSFGAWVTFGTQTDVTQGKKLLTLAYDAGVNFFDNAEAYANGVAETIMGKSIKDLGWKRDTFIVSSKVFFGSVTNPTPTQCGLHRKHITEACNAALKRLQVQYLDLYFCHRPDPKTPTEEIVESMTLLIRAGKVLYWGTSEWSAAQIIHAHSIAKERNLIPPVTEQPQYNLLHRGRVEDEYAILYKELGYGATVWSPLASGLLTGKYSDGIPKNSRLNLPGYEWLKKLLSKKFGGPSYISAIKKLTLIAGSLNIPLSRLSLAWCAKNPNISSVILGASKPSQLKENLKAIDDMPLLTDHVMKRIKTAISRIPNNIRYNNDN